MTNPQKFLEAWTNLKQKLLTTLTELKLTNKDNWAVVKSKSGLKSVPVLNDNELEVLGRKIAERESFIRHLNTRSEDQLLSPENQAALDQAVQELETLKSKQKIIITQVEPLPQAKEQATEYFQQLKQLHEKHDRLNDKLNWLRTLVRAGDLTQLQDLVRQAKI